MKEIPLTQGKVAIVDNEDFEYLGQWKWHVNSYGYAIRRIPSMGGKTIGMHREVMHTPTGLETDHINHNKLDNRKENLRVCTQAENQRNQSLSKKNTSGYKGVCWNKRNKKWQANIKAGGHLRHLGYYCAADDAARAYDEAARKFFGSFANLNFDKAGILY